VVSLFWLTINQLPPAGETTAAVAVNGTLGLLEIATGTQAVVTGYPLVIVNAGATADAVIVGGLPAFSRTGMFAEATVESLEAIVTVPLHP
jgi:hypothetical protein